MVTNLSFSPSLQIVPVSVLIFWRCFPQILSLKYWQSVFFPVNVATYREVFWSLVLRWSMNSDHAVGLLSKYQGHTPTLTSKAFSVNNNIDHIDHLYCTCGRTGQLTVPSRTLGKRSLGVDFFYLKSNRKKPWFSQWSFTQLNVTTIITNWVVYVTGALTK